MLTKLDEELLWNNLLAIEAEGDRQGDTSRGKWPLDRDDWNGGGRKF